MSEAHAIGDDIHALAARFVLQSRCARGAPEPLMGACAQPLAELRALLRDDLLALARRASPNDFVDIHASLSEALEQLRASCALPMLAGKWIVGFGGAFSAGKSSLINAMLREPLLPAEIDPTTSLPTYVMQGAGDEIAACNHLGNRIALSEEEFLSLSHDEQRVHGSEIASLLREAYVVRRAFAWSGLAFADTPGYSKPNSTDADIARARLNAAHSIVWVVNAENGGINESDLDFLATLRLDIPRVVIVTRADKKAAQEVNEIVQGIRDTLAARNLAVLDVIPFSRRSSAGYPAQPLLELFETWNARAPKPAFPRTFKLALRRYARFLESEQARAQTCMSETNGVLLAMSCGPQAAALLEPINRQAKADVARFTEMQQALQQLQRRCFALLERIGGALGADIREPTEIELLGQQRVALPAALSRMLDVRRAAIARYAPAWSVLDELPEVCDASALLRRNTRRYASSLDFLS